MFCTPYRGGMGHPDAGALGFSPTSRLTDMPECEEHRLAGIPDIRKSGYKGDPFVPAPPILSLASTKGGVGKTTLAFCLATEFARRMVGMPEYRDADSPVTVIDADPNQTLYGAIQRGQPAGVRAEVANGETLLSTVTKASRTARLVIIDLEGSSNQAMLYAAGKSSLVLIPAQPSLFDVVEAMKTHAVVEQAADLTGREIMARVVLSRTPVLRQRVTTHSRTQFEARGLPLLGCELMERAAFRVMSYSGQPPHAEDPTGGAAMNVSALTDEVAALLQITGMPDNRQSDTPKLRDAVQ